MPPLLKYRISPIHFQGPVLPCLEAGSARLLPELNGFHKNGNGKHPLTSGQAIHGKNGHKGTNGHGLPDWVAARLGRGLIESTQQVSAAGASNGHSKVLAGPQ